MRSLLGSVPCMISRRNRRAVIRYQIMLSAQSQNLSDGGTLRRTATLSRIGRVMDAGELRRREASLAEHPIVRGALILVILLAVRWFGVVLVVSGRDRLMP